MLSPSSGPPARFDPKACSSDGKRRWAKLRGLPASSGYEAVVRSLRLMVELCCKLGIGVLTVFTFSTDNWFRPKVSLILLVFLLLLYFHLLLHYKLSI